MADGVAAGTVLATLLEELAHQGFGPSDIRAGDPPTTYSVHGTLNVGALAEAIENALGGGALDEEAKAPADLNAANDG